MTISDLEKILRNYSPDADVFIRDRVTGCSFEIKEIHLNDDKEEVVIIVS